MTPLLTPEGYAKTKAKLAELERRLAELESRNDLTALHKTEVRQSYRNMIQQYIREIKLYEARRGVLTPDEAPGGT